jgi:hypothetical protein
MTAVLDPLDADDHAVAVHRLLELPGWECRYRRRTASGRPCHEAVAGRIGLQAADVEVHLFGQPESIPRIE